MERLALDFLLHLTKFFFRYVIATAIRNHLWEGSEGRRLSDGRLAILQFHN